ncbi:C6 zinc finger domain-containing protein [Emericellopsis cladophorae]|uniref:C6 zinc finger domain-containing protein n=1 Tax=Emericellopsis cladophorae TaxID=2686198 RepID=A0A9P9Y0Z6_9HYPO|nr:C6 zinc finger domain-containing protein [Emericellopsis cladophorae]KAI6781573.1 C6 zinc finger domain-containing protein [Emericellopsis cladophorae]
MAMSAEDLLADRARRHTRALFWVCYALDKDIALRSGKPPLLVGDYCDMTLPQRDDQTSSGQHITSIHELRLSIFKEQVYRFLYAPGAFGIPDTQHLLQLRHLDDELESWRLHIAFYAPIAAMSLFVNILIHPLGERADSDLEHLTMAVGVIRSIPLGNLSADDIDYAQTMCDFMVELIRLGNCAIWKTKKDGRSRCS